MKRRSGYSLVEAVGVIGAIGMLSTLSALMLNKTFDAHRSTLTHLQRMRSLELFVERWRDDLQTATQVTSGAELRITKSENLEVVYSIVNQSMVRTRRQDGQDVGHDHWQLPSQCTATWLVEDHGRIPLLLGKLEFNGTPIEFDDVTLVARIGRGESK
jgi:type II secretory pathway component PulJ